MVTMNSSRSVDWSQKSARAFCLTLLLALALTPPSWAKKHKAAAPAVDASYIAALAVANRFLNAWQGSDQEAALLLLTDRAKHNTSAVSIDALFQRGSNRGFEIVHGHPLSGSRYQFPIVLLQSADDSKPAHRKFTNIVVANTGKNDWAVDTLP